MDEQDPQALREQADEALADIDRMLAERAAARAGHMPAAEMPEPAAYREVQPRQRHAAHHRPPAQPQQSIMSPEASAGWNKWAIAIVDGRVGEATQKWIEEFVVEYMRNYSKHIAEVENRIGKEAREKTRAEQKAAIDALRDEMRAEIAASEERIRTALSAEIKIAALEARLEAAERRAPTPIRPRLVDGGGDAA